MNGIAGLEGIAKPDDVVMVHWSASPFVNEEELLSFFRKNGHFFMEKSKRALDMRDKYTTQRQRGLRWSMLLFWKTALRPARLPQPTLYMR